jgi:anti-sigma factor RsiW
MPACDQVKLLLGPFDDGELEPHEMEDVAFHVVTCGACKTVLDGYRSLGVALRDCAPQPPIEGFTAAVLKRIDQIPQPLWKRGQHYLEDLSERIGGTVSLAAAGAFAALLTAWLVTPYAQRLLHHSSILVQVASGDRNDMKGLAEHQAGASQKASPDQAESSMITLSNDPTTTVIWLPNQP